MNDQFKSTKLSRFLTLGKGLTKVSAQLALDVAKTKAHNLMERNPEIKDLGLKIKASKEIIQTMGELKGAMMKLGQMISISDDLLLPKEISDLFRDLQKNSPPMPDAEVRRMIFKSFNKYPEDLFLEFNPRPVAAASIGQVHRARLHTGEEVAVKIQYPKIVNAIKFDFQNLHKIDKLVHLLYPNKPNLDNLISELKTSLLEECNYLHEMEQLSFFKESYKDFFPMFIIPHVYSEFTTEEVLTMEWIEGDSYEETLNYTQSEKDFLGSSLYECFLFSLWELGRLHTDPQNGNYLFRRDKIIMLDFGSTRNFSKEFLMDYCLLFLSLENNDLELYGNICKKLDILKSDEKEELIARHFEIIKNLYGPYTEKGIRPITETNPLDMLRGFLKDLELKGRKSPRQEFLLLDRSTFGLYIKLKGWKSRIDWLQGRNKFRKSIENEVKIKHKYQEAL